MQVLDVQQARGTLEDVSTNLRVAVLAKFANFGVSDPNPLLIPHSIPKPTTASATDVGPAIMPCCNQNSADAGELLICIELHSLDLHEEHLCQSRIPKPVPHEYMNQ